ncbi:MAG: hypothetical protein FJ265_13795 [Planctomycetes bacterium]|nr:hypothetical protein [Planctomycetota bacterium]
MTADHASGPVVTFQVKKVVAVCFLEAVRLTLEQIGEHRMRFSQQGIEGPAELPRYYGEVRRLRDYLQRCASAFQDAVDLELSDGDAELLVACSRRAIWAIDLRVADPAIAADERQWLQKKRLVLGDWAVELAQRSPMLELPLPALSPVMTDGVKGVVVRIQRKLFESGRQSMIGPGRWSSTAAVAGVAAPIAADEFVPPSPTGFSAEPRVAPLGPAPPPSAADLLESQQLRDPRLRAMVGMDLRSYARAVAAHDHRVAAVLLAAIVEAVVLDHAIPRRAELQLQGAPDTWNPQAVLAKILADRGSPKDGSLAYSLFAARNLLRPAVQLLTPSAVTPAALEQLQEFARRALHAMGYGPARSGADPVPPALRQSGRSIGKPESD